MAASSSSASNGASDQNKPQNGMKQQTTNPGELVIDGKDRGRKQAKTFHQNKMKQQTTNPGEHVIDGKDHRPGKARPCHQCHQYRSSATACKNQRKKKPCKLLYCHNCLWNRYREKGEEAKVSEVWSCPRCRDICNCSYCRAKEGHLPAGNICGKAKVAEYASISELLNAKDPENFGRVKNANDTGAALKKRGASKKIGALRKKLKVNIFDGHVADTVVTESPTFKEIVVAEGTVLEVQPLTAIPLHQSTREEVNYPSDDMMEEVEEAAKISWSLVPGNPISTSHHTADLYADVNSDSEDYSPDANYPFEDVIEEADEAAGDHVTMVENVKMLTYHTILDTSERRKAMEDGIARLNQQNNEEGNKKKIDELVALKNDVDDLTTKIRGIGKTVSLMSHDIKNISKNVRIQASTTSADHQDLVKKVNRLQQSYNANKETQLHMMSLLTGISKQLNMSADDVKMGKKKLGDTSCRVEDNAQKKVDGDTHGPGPNGFEGYKRFQDKSLGKLPTMPETVQKPIHDLITVQELYHETVSTPQEETIVEVIVEGETLLMPKSWVLPTATYVVPATDYAQKKASNRPIQKGIQIREYVPEQTVKSAQTSQSPVKGKGKSVQYSVDEEFLREGEGIDEEEAVFIMIESNEDTEYNQNRLYCQMLEDLRESVQGKVQEYSALLEDEITESTVLVNKKRRWTLAVRMKGSHNFYITMSLLKDLEYAVLNAMLIKMKTCNSPLNEYMQRAIEEIAESKLPEINYNPHSVKYFHAKGENQVGLLNLERMDVHEVKLIKFVLQQILDSKVTQERQNAVAVIQVYLTSIGHIDSIGQYCHDFLTTSVVQNS